MPKKYIEAQPFPYPARLPDLLEWQKHSPLYLTNGCCENAHGSWELFMRLGLEFGVWNPDTHQIDNVPQGTFPPDIEDTFYPLTKEEATFIGETYVPSQYGGASLSYSVIYQGKKYLCPLIHVCYLENETFSRESYGGSEGGETAAEALGAAIKLAGRLKPKFQKIGGQVLVTEDDEQDRHAVMMLIPPKYVTERFATFDEYKGWVAGMIAE
jgi:hypothetical protein